MPTEEKPSKKVENIYWAPAAKYQIGNFVPEKRAESGMITQPEVPLQFENYIRVARTDKEAKFIESSAAFKDGHIKKVATMEDALRMTDQHKRFKDIRGGETSSITSTPVATHDV